MMLFAWGIAAVGLGIALAATLLARAGRLSIGHGTAWTLSGIALLGVGLLLGRLWQTRAPFTAGAAIALGLALALALAFGLAHAVTLSRLNERVKRLAQEIALQRGIAENLGPAGRAATETDATKDAAPRTG
jgi:hypothetical protein